MAKQEIKKNAKKVVNLVLKRLIKGKTKKKVAKKAKNTSRLSKKPSKESKDSKKVAKKAKIVVKKSVKLKKKQIKVIKKAKTDSRIAKKPLKVSKKPVKKAAAKSKKIKKEEPPIVVKKIKVYNVPITKDNITMVVSENVGDDALKIVFYLKGKKDVSEFVIADDTEIEIHAARNILYRLNSEGMVSYIRKKDKEKGWYISYWTFLNDRVPEHVFKLKEKRLNKFSARLEKEEGNQGNFYMCPNACVRMDFDGAMDANFKCMECGSLLNQQDNNRTIEGLKENIKKLKKELKKYKIF